MRTLFVSIFAAGLMIFSPVVKAQSAKPADVLLVVDTVKEELKLLFKASLMTAPSLKRLELNPKRPRHVYQKAREVFLKVQVLRRLNGLDEMRLPEAPTSEVTPANVRDLVYASRDGLQELYPLYWIAEVSVEVPKKNNASPTDVYQGLQGVSQLVDALGIPPVVPNDVYRIAQVIEQDMGKLYAARMGQAYSGSLPEPASGKSPKDVYEAEMAFLADLKAFTESAENAAIPAGISIPPQFEGRITPGRVLEIANSVLAEVGSLKVLAGADMRQELPEPPAGRTPSNVYDRIVTAHQLLRALK
ncbi:hypothetical protein [Kordiimonas laminariae]|uniref:hypothetical protein n=1 Tax=Kordiimonas laminariae TaxID=2917717 RepID=UPI001FF30581|nr:hypothetical protein [Kordiimonas laminariae]MCK0069367.1 hypothetical protein [Kordiimonas laminariae]